MTEDKSKDKSELEIEFMADITVASRISAATHMECPLCQDEFNCPKILQCAHRLCNNCLLQLLGDRKNAKCPICRFRITTTDTCPSQRRDADIAEAFPDDLAMGAVVECANFLRKDHVCHVHAQLPATEYCFSCEYTLCSDCAVAHKAMLVSHMTQDLASLTPYNMAPKRPPKCSSHISKTAKRFCSSHKGFICNECLVQAHRTCTDVMDCQEVITKARITLASLYSLLKAVESELSETAAKLERSLALEEKKMLELFKDIDAACDQLQRAVDVCRKRMKDLVRDARDKNQSYISKEKIILLQRQTMVTSHMLLLKSVIDVCPQSSIWGMASVFEKRISELDMKTESCRVPTSKVFIDMDKFHHLENQLLTCEVASFSPEYPYEHSTADRQVHARFHKIHGKNVKLTDDDRTAERVKLNDWRNVTVFIDNPMQIGCLYEVRGKQTIITNGMQIMLSWPMAPPVTGVTWTNPETMTSLPQGSQNLKSSLIIMPNRVFVTGREIKSLYGLKLNSLRSTTRVGVLVDSSFFLHLYIDGIDQGYLPFRLPQPCWAVFDLIDKTEKVSVLPVTTIHNYSCMIHLQESVEWPLFTK